MTRNRAERAGDEATAVPRKTIWVFALTIFVSASLLFQVQLILNKYILPWFGGSSAVWTTSMLVFQVLLLAGYLYSHLVSERLPQKGQTKLHLGILGAACLVVVMLSVVWPSAITPGVNWKPQSSATPVRDVITILLLAAGLPFFVLSTTGPLLQRWFSKLGGDARTYRLYAVSNLGSLVGLLIYPFLLEPVLRIRMQGRLWTVLFVLFCVGCAWCAWQTRTAGKDVDRKETGRAEAEDEPTNVAQRALWLLLPACASSLLLSTTNLLCQELTALPLLWVLPLALYLLSFVLCFDHPRWYRREIFHPLFVLGLLTFWASVRFRVVAIEIVVMPALLFVGCMVCHGELARLKPAVRRLTAFYLSVSAGGAAGGIFVALIAPQVFRYFVEFQLTLGACVVLLLWSLYLDEKSWIFRSGLGVAAAIVVGILVTAYVAGSGIPELAGLLEQWKFYAVGLVAGALVLVGAYLQKGQTWNGGRRFRAVQVLVILLCGLCMVALYQTQRMPASLVLAKRNFYGALRVIELPKGGKALYHGRALHGGQLDPPNNRLPMAYYGPESGIGILLQNHPKRTNGSGSLRVGVVGMGTGTLAAYGLSGDQIRYYEIDPDVVEISTGKQDVFTYVRDSQANVQTEVGDARLVLEREVGQGEAQNFDVLVLDAFSGDAIPVHLLTLEAFDTYWKQVNPENGIIAIHVSSRHINLMPVLEGSAEHYKASMLIRAQNAGYPFMPNLWVFLARHAKDLEVNGLDPVVPPLPEKAPRVWTDDYSEILSLLM